MEERGSLELEIIKKELFRLKEKYKLISKKGDEPEFPIESVEIILELERFIEEGFANLPF